VEVAGERRAMHFYHRGPYLPRWSARYCPLLPSRRFFRTGFTTPRRCNKPVLPFLLYRLPCLRCVHNVKIDFITRAATASCLILLVSDFANRSLYSCSFSLDVRKSISFFPVSQKQEMWMQYFWNIRDTDALKWREWSNVRRRLSVSR